MTSTLFFVITIVALLVVVEGSVLYVQNHCSTNQPVAFRGAYGKVYYEGSIDVNSQYAVEVNDTSCSSCNIGINTGSTLLAEFSITGGTTWWDLSTDAGYNYPPFLMYTSDPNSPRMYCDSPTCPDGTPGDSHIENSPSQYDIYVVYCGSI